MELELHNQSDSRCVQALIKKSNFFSENPVKATKEANYLRNHHQPDLVKVSQSPKVVTSNAELARLEHVLDEKNRENDRLRARLGHNAKGFEALAITVNHMAKKVRDFHH